jgi:hypothetical protein
MSGRLNVGKGLKPTYQVVRTEMNLKLKKYFRGLGDVQMERVLEGDRRGEMPAS